ncbi:hypothetical protein [Clostridium guangxiense]|uniref:hypothetical protein n=1 Tax=Clostridium guangxiense TaxID=1662055 RepID=UPI001E5A8FBC|nr:hypothetical protein [Clostridium guangxiense]MCD2347857.1 hypothetical protein [Clostridium guangxiense]
MTNFLISAVVDIVLIFASYFIFRSVISGPTRHKIYEKFISSFGKFVIYIFVVSTVITGLAAFILYRTRYVGYLNIAAPALVSIFIGFVVSTVPTRGVNENKKNHAH